MGPGGRPYQALICEDKKQEAQRLRQILESRGYHVVDVAENGRDLLRMLEEHRGKIDFVMLDIIMPVLDGYAAFHEMIEQKHSVRTIFLSVENSKAVIESLLRLGAAEYITKPFDRDSVLQKVEKALTKKAPVYE